MAQRVPDGCRPVNYSNAFFQENSLEDKMKVTLARSKLAPARNERNFLVPFMRDELAWR